MNNMFSEDVLKLIHLGYENDKVISKPINSRPGGVIRMIPKQDDRKIPYILASYNYPLELLPAFHTALYQILIGIECH